jgi:hypothetical protein
MDASSNEDDMPLLHFSRLRYSENPATALASSVQDRTVHGIISTVQHSGQPEQADNVTEQATRPQQRLSASPASLNRGAAAMSLLEADIAPESEQQDFRSERERNRLSLWPSDRFDLAVAAWWLDHKAVHAQTWCFVIRLCDPDCMRRHKEEHPPNADMYLTRSEKGHRRPPARLQLDGASSLSGKDTVPQLCSMMTVCCGSRQCGTLTSSTAVPPGAWIPQSKVGNQYMFVPVNCLYPKLASHAGSQIPEQAGESPVPSATQEGMESGDIPPAASPQPATMSAKLVGNASEVELVPDRCN